MENKTENLETLPFENKYNISERHSLDQGECQRSSSLSLEQSILIKQRNRLSLDCGQCLRKYSMNDDDKLQKFSSHNRSCHISHENITDIDSLDATCRSKLFSMASSVPSSNLMKNIIPTRNLSLRQKKTEKNSFLQYKSLSNISTLEKNTLIKEMNITRKLSNANASSMASLFEDELLQSPKSEYKIDWKAIFLKISEKTSNNIEISLINYFHNLNNNLQMFPSSSLYRFLTYDDVLASVFNNILSTDFHVNIHDEILSTPTQMSNFEYDIDTCYITKLIHCNIKRLTILIQEYQERKDNFGLTLEKWKFDLDQYLKNQDYTPRMHLLIRSICTKLESMSNIVIIVVELMSRWKLSKEFGHLYQSNQNELLMLKNCENTIADFRQSQKKLEQQMVNLIRLFKEDKCEEVLKLIDQIFSKNIELDVYLPIFKDKLKNDRKVLEFFDNTHMTISGEEQFV